MIRHGNIAAHSGLVLTIRCGTCGVRDDHEPSDDRCRTMQDERDLKNRED